MISNHLTAREYSKKQVILEPEDKDKVFILKSGQVEIYEITPSGKRIIIDVLTTGNVFGDLGIEDETGHFVEATLDSFVCVLGKQEFFEMVSQYPAISYQLIKELFSKTVESQKQIASLASDSVVTKIKNLMFRLASRYGEKENGWITITSKFTHEELADMIGISRPTLTEMLNKLEKQGVLKREGKIISYNPQKLTDI
ncbi:Crp/Fnr family transcriptional regulator [Candidatus Daviesbacteria bacterium]|nr:Crp/Fnr family transcriptional regulator [Candidatus Daviesbacteria bacterium]